MEKNHLEKIWKNHLEDKISKEEKKQLLEALENEDSQGEITLWLQEAWDDSTTELSDKVAHDHILKRLMQKIGEEAKTDNDQPTIYRKLLHYAVAACFVGLLSMFVWWIATMQAPQSQWVQLEVQAGEPAKTFELPDGSKVWLNAATTLDYNFSENRQVKLVGEAFFEVAKNKVLPFSVAFEGNELIVTGTQFNIKAYPNETNCEVHVREGSVSVYNAKDTSRIVKNEFLLIENAEGTYTQSFLAYDDSKNWLDGQLIFETASIEEVIRSIERHYGVHLSISNASTRKNREIMTATYPPNTTLKEVLEGLKYLKDIEEYKIINPDSLIIIEI